MSAKNLDHHNRWRNRTVAFRVSEEENILIDTFAKLSGHTKQTYITGRLLCALRDQLTAVLQELKKLEAGSEANDVLLETIQMIAKIMDGMKEEFDGG